MKIPVAIKILNEATGPKANVEFMDVSILKTKSKKETWQYNSNSSFIKITYCKLQAKCNVTTFCSKAC